jgi:glycosyltransferase involved in cell wall biosynthesis
LLAVATLKHLKGIDLLLRAFASLPRRDARLVIVGGGPDEQKLRKLARELGIEERVAMVGHRTDPFAYYHHASLLVLSSRTEAFPNVIGEAMAAGCPIVAADCSPGVREYLQDGKCGLLVESEDADALSRGIQRVLEDDALGRRLSAAARERVQEFEIHRAVENYERLLESLAA